MDELVKRLWKCAYGECFNCSQYTETTNASVCSKELMKQAADFIEELIRENESLAKSVDEASEILRRRWIPVTERLPEKNGSYLVYVYGEVTEMDYWRGKWHRLRDDYTKAVTHWMPLPPPKEE